MRKFLNKIINKIKKGQGDKGTEKISAGDSERKHDNVGSGTDWLPMQVAQEKQVATKSVLEIFCPYCASQNFVKRGTRQKKQERVQLYLCSDCQRTFTPGAVKGKHYPKAIILDAISLYNLGYSLEKACEIVNKMNNELNKS